METHHEALVNGAGSTSTTIKTRAGESPGPATIDAIMVWVGTTKHQAAREAPGLWG